MVKLENYQIVNLEFENGAPHDGSQLHLSNHYDYHVNYLNDGRHCIGELVFEITERDLKPYGMKITMNAVFSYDKEDSKPDIHVQSFSQLFPYLRMTVTNVNFCSGNDPLVIPFYNLNPDNVRLSNTPKTGDKDDMLN